tara:strand:+ start:164 stop:541 length:378 start_codon:yes stop_codon:yes gene_type:complete
MIKVGDLVEFINGNTYQGKLHNKVTSISDCGDYIGINGKSTGTRRSWLKLVDTSNWHKHHDVIIAWAKGAEIEYYSRSKSRWGTDTFPYWTRNMQYRIKPTDLTELEKLKAEHAAMGETIRRLTE